jgi:chemotaxis family two-component system sensor kinase Cph1
VSVMTTLSPGLNDCDREPIHIPGSIQPRGVMLVAERDGFCVRHVAGDIEGRLGSSAWQGQTLGELIGERLCGEIEGLSKSSAVGGLIGRFQTHKGESLDVSVFFTPPFVVVELEPASSPEPVVGMMMDRLAVAAAGFEHAASLAALCEKAAVEFRRLTGFDRVMVYRFLEDGAGEVLAEDKKEDWRSFLNHHFPASDIPLQARALYIRNIIRVISDVSYEAAVLRPEWRGSAPLDMSDSNLRSVSPIHLQYLRNMGVSASASVSIVKDGRLWGLIACHHDAPKWLTYDTRAACRSLVGTFSQHIKAREEALGYRQRMRLRGFEDDIVLALSREDSLMMALPHRLSEIARMLDADGVAVLGARDVFTHGMCPMDGEVREIAEWIQSQGSEPVFSTDYLSRHFPRAAHFKPRASGVLSLELSAVDPGLLIFFRAERAEIVNWAGNPHKSKDADPQSVLTPRASFQAWQETVDGHSRGWTLPELDAASRLRIALRDMMQNQRMRELNRQLTNTLHDKELLLKEKRFLIEEVNHRVQNSLQVVSSFLGIQARGSGSAEMKSALEEARGRVTAVALVHRRLHRGDQIEMVNAGRYIEELCSETFLFLGKEWAEQRTLNLSPVLISTDRAVTVGLVLTELLINCNKYAYNGASGPVEIELIEDRGQLRLAVADKGAGAVSPRKGVGSRIIDALVTRMGGTVVLSDNRPGLRTTVTMPVQKVSDRMA